VLWAHGVATAQRLQADPGESNWLESRCRRCRSEASRHWRQQNAGHVERYNACRRIGPRERQCVDCGSALSGLRSLPRLPSRAQDRAAEGAANVFYGLTGQAHARPVS
jgi:hypothetical protein